MTKRSRGHAGGQDCMPPRIVLPTQSRIWCAGTADRRKRSAVALVNASAKTYEFAGTSDAGGGTRTPDTRIMIPLCFGSTAGFEGAGGPKRGQECATACGAGLAALSRSEAAGARAHLGGLWAAGG